MVKQDSLNKIHESILKYRETQRGDDILVSYAIKKAYNLKHLPTISGKVLNLGEGDVGLNKHPDHFSMRWEVLQECLS